MYQFVYKLFEGIMLCLNILSWVLIIYALSTWFVRPNSKLYTTLQRLAEPFVAPFRGVSRMLISRGLPFDISVPIALIAIQVLQRVLYYAMGYALRLMR